MLIAAAVCPHPPLLVPAALGGAATGPPDELRKVTAAAQLAVSALLAVAPDLVAVVGGGPADREYGPDAAGSLQDFGVPVTVGTGTPVLPLSLTVGRWLLECAGLLAGPAGLDGPAAPALAANPPAVVFQAVNQRAGAAECRKLGIVIAARAPRVALLAMGDASARRAREAPGVPDPVAEEYDEEVAEALAAGDDRWLGTLDPALDGELLVAGRAAWQVMAGAAAGRRLHGRLLCMTAPYGVTYLVATWREPAGEQ